MATSMRLPEPLKAEAAAYAAGAGISLNALVCVALREFLDGRPGRAPGPGAPAAGGADLAPVVGDSVSVAPVAGPAVSRQVLRAELRRKRKGKR